MRTAALATLALALVACSAEPRGHKWQVDEQGNRIPGTEVPVWTEGEVEAVRQALAFNVIYNFDCGASRTPNLGEVLLFDGPSSTAECSVISGPGKIGDQMIISFNDPTAKWQSGKSWNDQVSSMRARPHGLIGGVGPIGMCIRLRQNVGGSDNAGWGPAKWDLGTDGELNLPSLVPFGDASMIIVRAKKFGETGCII